MTRISFLPLAHTRIRGQEGSKLNGRAKQSARRERMEATLMNTPQAKQCGFVFMNAQCGLPAGHLGAHIAEQAMPKVGRSKAAKADRAISFHSDGTPFEAKDAHPAINVKYRGPFPEGGTDEQRNLAWDATVEDFWASATEIAIERGYSGVFSEGRSSGWCVPYYQYTPDGKLSTQWTGQGPDKGYPRYPDVAKTFERNRFLAFQRKIKALLADVPRMLAEQLKERAQ